MKQYLKSIFVVLFSLATLLSYADTVVFRVGSGVCTPVTVTCKGKTYTVYNTLTLSNITGSIYVSATDCHGNKLKYDFSSRKSGGESTDTYTFRNPDTYSSGNSGGYNSSYNSGRYDSGARIGQGIARGIFSLGGGPSTLEAQLGLSRTYGENVRLKLGYEGFLLYAGVGKDWVFNSEYKNRVLWHAGIGSYFANNAYGVSLGISAGGLAQYDKVSLMIDSDFTYWFGRWHRVGVFAGGSLGWGSFSKVFDPDDLDNNGKFAWNVEVGLVFNICEL